MDIRLWSEEQGIYEVSHKSQADKGGINVPTGE